MRSKVIYKLTEREAAVVAEYNAQLQIALKTIAQINSVPKNATFDVDAYQFFTMEQETSDEKVLQPNDQEK